MDTYAGQNGNDMRWARRRERREVPMSPPGVRDHVACGWVTVSPICGHGLPLSFSVRRVSRVEEDGGTTPRRSVDWLLVSSFSARRVSVSYTHKCRSWSVRLHVFAESVLSSGPEPNSHKFKDDVQYYSRLCARVKAESRSSRKKERLNLGLRRSSASSSALA
jgi:hypothetical protein